MNWTIYGIEVVIIVVCFALLVSTLITINPVSFISDFPPEIQEEYYRSQKQEKNKETLSQIMIIKKVIALIVALILCVWMAHLVGAKTFIQGSLLTFSYIGIVAMFDTFVLDWIFFARVKRWRLPGTEHMDKEYHQKWFHLKEILLVLPLGIVFAILSGIIMVMIF